MKKLLPLLLLVLPFTTFAHDGHGHSEGFTIIHYFTEPQHAVINLLAVAVVFLFYKTIRRKEDKA